MTEYRFSLQKYKRGTKLSCPNCGKKQCFVKYIDNQGEITFPDYVGRCDHELGKYNGEDQRHNTFDAEKIAQTFNRYKEKYR